MAYVARVANVAARAANARCFDVVVSDVNGGFGETPESAIEQGWKILQFVIE